MADIKPMPNESEDAFIARFVAAKRKEFPTEKHCAAAAYRAWRSHHGGGRASVAAQAHERDAITAIMIRDDCSAEWAALRQRVERAAAHVRRTVPPHQLAAIMRRPAPTAEQDEVSRIFDRARLAGWLEPEVRSDPAHMRPEALARHRAACDQIIRELRAAGLDGLVERTMRNMRTPAAAQPLTVATLCKLAKVPFEPYASMTLDEARAAITRAKATEDEHMVINSRRRVDAGEMVSGADAARAALDRSIEAINARFDDGVQP